MADKYQGEITSLLHKHHIFTRHEKPIPFTKGKQVVGWSSPERNTPDLSGGLVHHINVEVKTGQSSFSFDMITPGQYMYARDWREIRGCEYWFAIFFVLPYAPQEGSRIKRALFLVPYPELIRAKEELAAFQKSIPFVIEKGMKREVQEQNLCAMRLWQQFRLGYSTREKWFFLPGHPFAGMYLNQKPYLYKA